MSEQEYQKTTLDKVADGAGATNASFTGGNGLFQMYNNFTHTDMFGLPDMPLGMNDFARPLGLNYDPPAVPGAPVAPTPGEAAMQAPLGESGMPTPSPAPELSAAEEDAWFAGASNPAALEAGQASEELEAARAGASATSDALAGVGGALGIVGGGIQAYDGYKRFTRDGATEQDEVHGGLDMFGGAAGVTAGGLGLATLAGVGGTALAGASAVAAPVAAAIGLGVAGDHHAEEMHLFGNDADGKPQGAVEAAWNEGQHLGDAADQALGGGTLGLIGGAATAGLSTAALETGAVVADVGLGIDSLGANGMFGTTANYDGKGTHNMGAFEALDKGGQALGNGADDLLGLDHDSLGGEIVGGGVRAVTDVLGAGAALAGDVVGGVASLGSWIGDWF